LDRPTDPDFRRARSCYGHFAGETAARIADAMLDHGWIERAGRDFALTAAGEKKLAALGIDLDALRSAKRHFARVCIDLTERRPHVAGALGDALLDAYVSRGWVKRRAGSRTVDITPDGARAFRRAFGV
jgi:hypothetical protein